jgi:hypothetical protein
MDGTSYPVSFSVDYPDRELDRVTSIFRIFTIIPVAIVLGAVAAAEPGSGATATGPQGPRRARAACCSSARCS